MTLAELTEKLVPVSDFSQGKAGKIFKDVYDNNNEYIVLKNNQPTAVVVSVKQYQEAQKKIARLEKFLEMMEDYRLLKTAESRDATEADDFYSFLMQEGFDLEELKQLENEVELE